LPDIDERASNWPAPLGDHNAGEFHELATHTGLDQISALGRIRFEIRAGCLMRSGLIAVVAGGRHRWWPAIGAVERRNRDTEGRGDERACEEHPTPSLYAILACEMLGHTAVPLSQMIAVRCLSSPAPTAILARQLDSGLSCDAADAARVAIHRAKK
jgi:hypothetical protein